MWRHMQVPRARHSAVHTLRLPIMSSGQFPGFDS